jgi:hypothetical protein
MQDDYNLGLIVTSVGVFISMFYLLCTRMFQKNKNIKKGLDYLFPIVYLSTVTLGLILYTLPMRAGVYMQLAIAVASIVAGFTYSYFVGILAKNGVDKQLKQILALLWKPVEFTINMFKSIWMSIINVGISFYNLFVDIIFEFKISYTNIYNTVAGVYEDIEAIILSIFDAISGAFTTIFDILYNIVSMGGNIPDKALPPSLPLPGK